MEGKYVIEVKVYNKPRSMIYIHKCFKGAKKKTYEQAMEYAYKQANKYSEKGIDFTVTIHGEGWQTASNINP